MLNSFVRQLVPIQLPFAERQKYMHTFDTETLRMAEGFDDYREIVGELCRAAGHVGVAHMTVDEAIVPAGRSQRRPGAHVDGRFMNQNWQHPTPGWLHYCNNIPTSAIPRMAVIVAASVPGCKVYEGQFDGQPSMDGDLEHIRDQLGQGVLLPAGMGYLLSPDCVHESLRFSVPTKRTFLRIALEG